MSDYYSKSKQRKPLNTGDRRIRKTKQNIRNALFRILEKKSIDKITVAEIVQEADINRSTFYFYYEDIYDLFRQTETEVFETFVRDIVATDFAFSDKKDFVTYLTKYLEFCRQNSTVCKFVTANACNNELADRIRAELKKTIPNSRSIYDETDPRFYLTTFALSGFLFAILEWMDDGMRIAPAEMADFLTETYLSGSLFVKRKY
ncbi:MAG: TetR/AcrR family transcriptional regulator [Clostridia bacterium]|nr:TetR/AcrR family transcriptional regulator [Clostridia bacterium]MBR0509053.1 TetR/AcrR family transcriptional regulator [Clostridia bacterium]